MSGPATDGGGGFHKTATTDVYRGRVVHVTRSCFEGPTGASFERDVVHTPDAVAVVPLDPAAGGWDVVLVRQYRPALERYVLEIPAGMRDVEGEPAEETAVRELAEEAGYRAREIRPLVVFHPAPGFTTHRTEILVGFGLERVERSPHGPEEEAMTVERLPLEEAIGLVQQGDCDAKTLIGLLMARDLLEGRGE